MFLLQITTFLPWALPAHSHVIYHVSRKPITTRLNSCTNVSPSPSTSSSIDSSRRLHFPNLMLLRRFWMRNQRVRQRFSQLRRQWTHTIQCLVNIMSQTRSSLLSWAVCFRLKCVSLRHRFEVSSKVFVKVRALFDSLSERSLLLVF